MKKVAILGVVAGLLSAIGVTLVAAPAANAAPVCDPGTRFVVTSNKPNNMRVLERGYLINGTGHGQYMYYHAERSATTSWSVSASISAEAKLKTFGKIKASVNGSVAQSKSYRVGYAIRAWVPAHKTYRVDYGVLNEVVSGYSYYVYKTCQKSSRTYLTAQAPYGSWFLRLS
jgi:hypothetical protein